MFCEVAVSFRMPYKGLVSVHTINKDIVWAILYEAFREQYFEGIAHFISPKSLMFEVIKKIDMPISGSSTTNALGMPIYFENGLWTVVPQSVLLNSAAGRHRKYFCS